MSIQWISFLTSSLYFSRRPYKETLDVFAYFRSTQANQSLTPSTKRYSMLSHVWFAPSTTT